MRAPIDSPPVTESMPLENLMLHKVGPLMQQFAASQGGPASAGGGSSSTLPVALAAHTLIVRPTRDRLNARPKPRYFGEAASESVGC